jgi:hypothetical protein
VFGIVGEMDGYCGKKLWDGKECGRDWVNWLSKEEKLGNGRVE